jgi:ubiquinone/menaquinone biosynthesis C-methylase UbiE
MTGDTPAYFANVAEQWDEIRTGYFTEHMRDAAIAKGGALQATPLHLEAVVVDVGTGTGFVALGLAPKVAKVIGFDASPEMLAVARRNLAAFSNVEFREAPGDHLPLPDGALDAAFANMYLHHAPDPAGAIRELARVLKPGGVLCLTDLDTHDHAWQREQMADLWLGFERDDIRRWFAEAGLTGIDVDCAEGACCAADPTGKVEPLSIFVAIGRKQSLQRAILT